jgi:hypothetical protein
MVWRERQRPGTLEFQRFRPLAVLGPDGLVRTSRGLSADCAGSGLGLVVPGISAARLSGIGHAGRKRCLDA